MKDKKASTLLPEETLKIVIAILCILVLVYLAFSLYSLFIVKSKLAQARSVFKEVVAGVKGVGDTEENLLVTSPKDWVIVSRERELCMCDKDDVGADKKKCCEKGIAEEIENARVEDVCSVGSNKVYRNCILLDNLPRYIYFSKSGEIVNVVANKPEGILKELLEYNVNGKNVLEALKTDIIKPSTEPYSKEYKDLQNAMDKFFADRRIDYYLEVQKKTYWFSQSSDFTSYNNPTIKSPKQLIYGYVVNDGREDRYYEINLKYKER